MGRIRVSTTIDATPATVWEEVRHLDRHVDWMTDAETITFTTAETSGEGTRFDCVTKVGPITLTDAMTVTEWRDGREIGVRHSGLVTGTGAFTLADLPGDRTRFTWQEQLRFPWWMGGPVGGAVGGVVMRRIWKKNLQTLKQLVEQGRT